MLKNAIVVCDMTVRIDNKQKLKEVLYKQGFDKIVIQEDGSWKNYSNTTQVSGDVVLPRRKHYDLSKNDTKYLVKLAEVALNSERPHLILSRFSYSTGYQRDEVQEAWEKL